jgi:hypothetical protein
MNVSDSYIYTPNRTFNFTTLPAANATTTLVPAFPLNRTIVMVNLTDENNNTINNGRVTCNQTGENATQLANGSYSLNTTMYHSDDLSNTSCTVMAYYLNIPMIDSNNPNLFVNNGTLGQFNLTVNISHPQFNSI